MARNTEVSSARKEYVKLFIIVAIIMAATTLMSTNVNFTAENWVRWFMGSFLLVFGSFKLISYESFIDILPRYDNFAQRFPLYAYAYPFLEIILGMMFILDFAPFIRDASTLILATLGAVHMFRGVLRRGPTIRSAYLGNFIRLPISTVIMFENILIAFMAVIMIVLRISAA